MNLRILSLSNFTELRVPQLQTEEVHLWCVQSAVWEKMGWEKNASREILSRVLAAYPGIKGTLSYEIYGEGKPRLRAEQNPNRIHFNLSHSKELLVIAVTAIGEIGVDVERLRPMEKMNELSERFYLESERQVIEAAPENEKQRIFFQIWTAKEAWAKLHATSIFRVLGQFELKEMHYPSTIDPKACYVGSIFTQAGFLSFQI